MQIKRWIKRLGFGAHSFWLRDSSGWLFCILAIWPRTKHTN